MNMQCTTTFHNKIKIHSIPYDRKFVTLQFLQPPPLQSLPSEAIKHPISMQAASGQKKTKKFACKKRESTPLHNAWYRA